MRELSWLIPLLPILSFATIVLFAHNNRKLSAGISIGAIAFGFVFAVMLLFRQLGDNTEFEWSYAWAVFPTLKLEVGIFIDSLTTMMLVVVSMV